MLTDSNSPLNDLQNLRDWLALPATQEALAHLKVRSKQARRASQQTVQGFRIMVGSQPVLPDHGMATEMRAEFRGNAEGLEYLQKTIDERLVELQKLTGEIKETKE